MASRGDFSIDWRGDEIPRPLDFSSLAFAVARRGDDIRRGDEAMIGDSIERHLKERVECRVTICGVLLSRSDGDKQTLACLDPSRPAAKGSCETLYVKHKMKETILFEASQSHAQTHSTSELTMPAC